MLLKITVATAMLHLPYCKYEDFPEIENVCFNNLKISTPQRKILHLQHMHNGINNSEHVFFSLKIHFWHAISPKNPGEDHLPYNILEVYVVALVK